MTKRRADFPIVGSFNSDPILKVDAQRTINLYEVIDQEAKKPKYLVPWPGFTEVATFTNPGVMRAGVVFKGNAYYVVGNTIYEVTPGFTVNIIANAFFTTVTGFVGISTNENEVAFVDGVKFALWNATTTTFTDVTPLLPTDVLPLDITFFDGYFILISSDPLTRNAFYISKLNDGTKWKEGGPAGDFALVNSRPTELEAISALKRRVFLFGKTKAEIWLDAGAADFPFRRDNNLLLEHGIKAPASLTEGFDRLFYLSGDEDGVGSIMMVLGTLPRPISTREVDEAIQEFDTPEDAEGFVFKINGQIFYQINFTGGNTTFIYNVNTNKWHQAEMLNGDRHLGTGHTFFNNKHLIGDYQTNKLYEYRTDLLNNNGEKIKRTRICRLFSSPTYERIRVDRLWVDMLQGVGKKNTKGLDAEMFPFPPASSDVDPQLFLSVSEDGGATFKDFGGRPIGKSGKRLTRTFWARLGVRRDWLCKFEMYNEVPTYILGAAIDYEVLPE